MFRTATDWLADSHCIFGLALPLVLGFHRGFGNSTLADMCGPHSGVHGGGRRRRRRLERRLLGVNMQLNQTHLPLSNPDKPDNAVSGGSTLQQDTPEREFLNQLGEANVQVDEAAVGAWYQHYLKASGKTSNEQDLNELRSVLVEMELAEQFGEGDSWACG